MPDVLPTCWAPFHAGPSNDIREIVFRHGGWGASHTGWDFSTRIGWCRKCRARSFGQWKYAATHPGGRTARAAGEERK